MPIARPSLARRLACEALNRLIFAVRLNISQRREEPKLPKVEPLLRSIEATPIATVVTNPRLPDNPIVAANEAFCRLTGYGLHEILGRNCRFLSAPAGESLSRTTLRQAIDAARPSLVEIVNYRKDGTAFRNAVMIAPLRDASGNLAWFVGSQMEVGCDGGLEQASVLAELQHKLTPRQLTVLEMMVTGLRNKQIAERLAISEKTVKMHRRDLLRRLGAATSADAVRIGVEAGLHLPPRACSPEI